MKQADTKGHAPIRDVSPSLTCSHPFSSFGGFEIREQERKLKLYVCVSQTVATSLVLIIKFDNTRGEVAAHSVHRSSDGLVLCLVRGVHADKQ